MASAKLVTVNHHLHPFPSLTRGNGLLSSGSLSSHPSNHPTEIISSPPARPATPPKLAPPAMTLDYSLPRGRDLDPGSLTSPRLKPSAMEAFHLDHLNAGADCDEGGDGREKINCVSPSPNSPEEMTTRKNKRKLSSPRRRADLPEGEPAVDVPPKKRKHLTYSPLSPAGEDDDSGVDSYKSVDDSVFESVTSAKSAGQTISSEYSHSKRLDHKSLVGLEKSVDRLASPSSLTTSNLSSLASSASFLPIKQNISAQSVPPKKSKPSKGARNSSSSKSTKTHSVSKSAHAHEHEKAERVPEKPSTPSPIAPHPEAFLHPGLPPNFLHPMLTPAGTPEAVAALGLVPGLYFGSHPGLHPSLAMLPPHMQHAYLAAAAAAQASALAPPPPPSHSAPAETVRSSSQSQSTPRPSSSIHPPSTCGDESLPESKAHGSESRSRKHSGKQKGASGKSSKHKQLQHRQATSTSPHPNRQQKTSSLSSSSSSSSSSTPQPIESIPSTSTAATTFPTPLLHYHHLQHPQQESGITNSQSALPSERFSDTRRLSSGPLAEDNDSSSSRPQSPEDLSMPGCSDGGGGGGERMSRKHRKNYKNMTRERRVEANARERTRVHTISAAFEALRRAVPSYSHNQKLSKLAILRIACSYIMSLARLGDMDYTTPAEHIGHPMDFAECVEMTTNTIQTEGRARRRH